MKKTQKEEEEEKAKLQQSFKKPEPTFFEKIQESSVYKVATGKAFGRVIGIACIAAGIAGLMATAPVAIAITAVGMAGAVALDAYMVARTKNVYKEAKMLRDNKIALARQKNVLSQNKGISEALADKLIIPEKEGASKNTTPESTNSIASYLAGGIGAIVESLGGIVNNILSGNKIMTVVSLGLSVMGAKSGGEAKASMSEVRKDLREFIAKEQKDENAPGYDNKAQLKDEVNKQRIQAMALEELAQIEGINALPKEQIQEKFKEISENIATRSNKIQDSRNVFTKYVRKIFKNVITAHNPFSKHTDSKILDEKINTNRLMSEEQQITKQQTKDLKKLVGPLKESLQKNKNEVSNLNRPSKKTDKNNQIERN